MSKNSQVVSTNVNQEANTKKKRKILSDDQSSNNLQYTCTNIQSFVQSSIQNTSKLVEKTSFNVNFLRSK